MCSACPPTGDGGNVGGGGGTNGNGGAPDGVLIGGRAKDTIGTGASANTQPPGSGPGMRSSFLRAAWPCTLCRLPCPQRALPPCSNSSVADGVGATTPPVRVIDATPRCAARSSDGGGGDSNEEGTGDGTPQNTAEQTGTMDACNSFLCVIECEDTCGWCVKLT